MRVIPVASKCEVNSAALDFVGSISADFDALGFGEVRRNAEGILYFGYSIGSATTWSASVLANPIINGFGAPQLWPSRKLPKLLPKAKTRVVMRSDSAGAHSATTILPCRSALNAVGIS